jgi:flavodoxin
MTTSSNGQTPPVGRILIVYLSRTNNTKAIAEIIHGYAGGKLVALELQKPYPENYRQTVQQVVTENETGYLPPLKTKIESIQNYDVIFIGFPTWDMQLPPPVKFNTNAGYGVGSGFQTVKELCPNSRVVEGFSTKGGVEKDGIYFVMQGEKESQARDEIKKWLGRIGLLK